MGTFSLASCTLARILEVLSWFALLGSLLLVTPFPLGGLALTLIIRRVGLGCWLLVRLFTVPAHREVLLERRDGLIRRVDVPWDGGEGHLIRVRVCVEVNLLPLCGGENKVVWPHGLKEDDDIINPLLQT